MGEGGKASQAVTSVHHSMSAPFEEELPIQGNFEGNCLEPGMEKLPEDRALSNGALSGSERLEGDPSAAEHLGALPLTPS